MPVQSWGKRGFLACFGQKIGPSDHIFRDIDFKFVFPVIYIDIKGKSRWKPIGPKLKILSFKNHKMAISQNPILPKPSPTIFHDFV